MHLRWLGVFLAVCWLAVACSKSFQPEAGSESHFLQRCKSDDECGPTLSCQNAVCTKACTSDPTCELLSSMSTCRPAVPAGGVSLCDVECDEDLACEAVDDALACNTGYCRPTATGVPTVDAGPVVDGPPDGG